MKVVDLHGDLTQLISLAKTNDRQAQKLIYNKFSPSILSVCRQYIQDIYKAEDVLVTAFLKVFTHLKNFEHRGSFEGWIRRIAVNECISHIRAHQKVKFVEQEDHFLATDQADESLMAKDIQDMIDLLPDGCRMVFNLFAIEGFKHQEIAEMLQITEGTSKSQLAYARKLLQNIYTNHQISNHG